MTISEKYNGLVTASILVALVVLVAAVNGGGFDWIIPSATRALDFIFVELPIWVIELYNS